MAQTTGAVKRMVASYSFVSPMVVALRMTRGHAIFWPKWLQFLRTPTNMNG